MNIWQLLAILALPVIGVGGTILQIIVRKARGQRAGEAIKPTPEHPGSAMKNSQRRP